MFDLGFDLKFESDFKKEEFLVADTAVFTKQGIHLSDIQKTVLKGAWQGYTYDEIAEKEGYSEKYLKRDVGPKLWNMLSEALGEKVTKKNFQTAIQRKLEDTKYLLPQESTITNVHQDWGDAVDVSLFYGRSQELATLEQWIVNDRCRMIALLGMGGSGKTALAVELAKQVQNDFEYVIWRSLRNIPLVEDLLAELIHFLSNQQETDLPENINARMLRLLNHLRKHRCLLVLDNAESILPNFGSARYYREEYEGYAQLLKCVGETYHQSCLILTSREKPRILVLKEGENLPVRSLQLMGLKGTEGQQSLKVNGISGSEDECRNLIGLYGGNPLFLKIVSTTIQDVFDGNISEFLEQGIIVFNEIRDFLNQQFERLSQIEKEIMYWLAINREPVSLRELIEDVLQKVYPLELVEALESLRRRSMIEENRGLFTQQPILMEYMTERLIKQFCEEFTTQEMVFFRNYSLIKAQAKDYVRDTQIHLILKPVADRLLAIFGSKRNLEIHLRRILWTLQEQECIPTLQQYKEIVRFEYSNYRFFINKSLPFHCFC